MEIDYIEMAILELEKRNAISASFARTMYNGMKSRIAQLEAAQQSFAPDVAICEDCKKNPALEGCSVCAECGL